MKFTRYLITILIAAFVALIFLGAPTAAQATEAPEETEAPEQVEVFWLTGNTTEPTAETVTWPQALADPNNLACGTWYQVDTYPVNAVADLVADGVLTQGEDYGIVVSWRFMFGGDCVPVQPPDVVSGASSTAVDCVARIRTVTQTETRTTHALIENVWVLQAPVTVEIGHDTGETSVEECPLPAAPAAPATALRVSETAVLAETGPIEDSVPWFIASLLVALGSIGVVLAARARRITE